MAVHSSDTLPEMLPSALETLIPGFSLFTRILSLYLQFDVSNVSSYILFFIILSAFFKFALNNSRQYFSVKKSSFTPPWTDDDSGDTIERLIDLRRSPRPSLSNIWLTDAETITIYTLRRGVLTELLEEVQKLYLECKSSQVAIYRGLNVQNMLCWALSSSKPRPLSTLALDSRMKEEIISDIENFFVPKKTKLV
ncbi:hypothetical protein N7495_007665 [Penicillium taxi]|uniref:uncharacterized protein n=1 Tax=Penicillium taxi TaxID=168475 RepID=UPI0025459EF9|nr:uncharacterized protein N7495_007665 [Penicillium taxi]KAJ5887624.1 hypothetical protein N7495_007665 [Penicillium taxi]